MKTTRFTSLGYRKIKSGMWLIYDLLGDRPAQIGSSYRTQIELLTDLERFATERGY